MRTFSCLVLALSALLATIAFVNGSKLEVGKNGEQRALTLEALEGELKQQQDVADAERVGRQIGFGPGYYGPPGFGSGFGPGPGSGYGFRYGLPYYGGGFRPFPPFFAGLYRHGFHHHG